MIQFKEEWYELLNVIIVYMNYLHDAPSAYAAVVCSNGLKCFTTFAKPSILVHPVEVVKTVNTHSKRSRK